MSAFEPPRERTELPLVIAFADLTGFALQCTRVTDGELADVVDGFYELVAARAEAAGGRVVKFIGDAALIVFAPERVDEAVLGLCDVKAAADAYFAARAWDCRLHVKVHLGPVVAGPYGAAGDKRFDVLGRNVNAAAMLDSTGVALSDEVFQALSAETRARFKAHAWPVTYIRDEDPHRFRRR